MTSVPRYFFYVHRGGFKTLGLDEQFLDIRFHDVSCTRIALGSISKFKKIKFRDMNSHEIPCLRLFPRELAPSLREGARLPTENLYGTPVNNLPSTYTKYTPTQNLGYFIENKTFD